MFIDQARERDNVHTAATMLEAVAILVVDHEPETAFVLSRRNQRAWPALGIVDPVGARLIDPQRRPDLEARVAEMTVDDAIALARDVLAHHFPG